MLAFLLFTLNKLLLVGFNFDLKLAQLTSGTEIVK